ncbi:MAG: DUF4129 domain-containing protein [Ardenticatenia bacterium]|nr:MAG: DUF4129 domain-containing protein [Ardenticatenia bacterium]
MRSALALRIRWELLHLCIATFEATWVYAWVEAFHAPGDAHIGFGALWFYAVVLFTFSRFVIAQETWTNRRQWLVLGGTAVGLALLLLQLTLFPTYGWLGLHDMYELLASPVALFLGSVSPLTSGGIAFLLVWFRLIHNYEFQFTSYRFRLGVLFLFAALLVDTSSPSVGWWVPVMYFVSGLVAIALARAEDVSEMTKGEALPFTPQWFLTLFVGVIVMFIAASFIAWLFSDNGIAWLRENVPLLFVVGNKVVDLFLYLAYYIAAFIFWLLSPLLRIFQDALSGARPLTLQLPPTPTPMAEETQPVFSENWAWLKTVWNILRIIAPMAITALLFWLGFEMTQREEQTGADVYADFTTVAQKEQEEDSLLDKLMARGRRFFRWPRGAEYRIESIRDLYRNLLILGERVGHPRHPDQTPLEYWEQLRMIWPSLSEPILQLTQTYIETRYGHEPVDEDTLEELRRVWETIRTFVTTQKAHSDSKHKISSKTSPM